MITESKNDVEKILLHKERFPPKVIFDLTECLILKAI